MSLKRQNDVLGMYGWGRLTPDGIYIIPDGAIQGLMRLYIKQSKGQKILPQFPFLQLPPLSKWDVSQVTDMSKLFKDSDSLDGGDIARMLQKEDISGWDVSNVTDMWGIFDTRAYSTPITQNLNNWNVKNVKKLPVSWKTYGLEYVEPSSVQSWVKQNPKAFKREYDMVQYKLSQIPIAPRLTSLSSLPAADRENIGNLENILKMSPPPQEEDQEQMQEQEQIQEQEQMQQPTRRSTRSTVQAADLAPPLEFKRAARRAPAPKNEAAESVEEEWRSEYYDPETKPETGGRKSRRKRKTTRRKISKKRDTKRRYSKR
jgi:surface protein